MVSKAREDLPLPESPVTTTITSRGRETFTFFRLCSRAPRTTIRFSAISDHPFSKVASTKVYGPPWGGQVRNRFPGILSLAARRMDAVRAAVLWAPGPLPLLTGAAFLAFRLRYSHHPRA